MTTVRYCKLSSQKSQYQTLLENYEQEAKNLIGKTPNWYRLNELKEHKIILKELEFFRGRGQLDIWVNEPDTNAVISMNLIRLLSGTNFRLISEAEAKKISESVKQPFYKNNLDLYAKIENYLDYYEQVNIEFCNYLDNFNLYQAQELKGLRLKVKYPEIQKINRQLERLPLTTCVIDPNQYDIPALKRRYKLPAFFELHYVKDQSNKLYPVAFGLDALLLDSLFFWQKNNTAMIC